MVTIRTRTLIFAGYRRVPSMRKILFTVIAASLGLTGSASVAGAELFSATRAVIAVVADDLYMGQAKGHLNGAGTLAIHSQKNPDLVCRGEFTSSAERGGSGEMQCSDGSVTTFQFKRLSVFSGYGVGNSGRGSMSFVYGLGPEEARPYLTLPKGKKLTQSGTVLALSDM